MKCRSGVIGVATVALFWAAVFSSAAQSGWGRSPRQTISLRLADGTSVTVVEAEKGGDGHRYQYLPAHLTLSRNRNNLEFSFLPYRENDDGPLQGAIMHFLISWGLTAEQEKELQSMIRAKVDTLGLLEGAVPVQAVEGRSWEITARRPIGTVLNRGLASSGQVPTSPGHKMAVAFRFDSRDAKVVDEMLRGKKGLWGDTIRLFFLVGMGDSIRSRSDEADWILETDLGMLLPRRGH